MLGSLMVDLSTNLPWYLCAQKSKINVEWGNKCKNKGMNERDLGGPIWAVSSPHSSSPPGGWEGKESHTCTAKAEETGRGCKGCEGHPAVDLKEMRTSSPSAAFLLFLVTPHYRRWNSEFIAPRRTSVFFVTVELSGKGEAEKCGRSWWTPRSSPTVCASVIKWWWFHRCWK